MLRSLLVPLDGSPAAELALPWALSIACPTNGKVRLVRISYPPAGMIGAEGLASADPGLYQTLQTMEQDYLKRVAEQYQTLECEVSYQLIEGDEPAANILRRVVEEASIDLTVMTTHGRGPFTRFWLGSVADEFLQQSPRPILLLRNDQSAALDPRSRPKVERVLIPLDGSELAAQVLEPALALAGLYDSPVTLLRVLTHREEIRAQSSPDALPMTGPESSVLAKLQDELEQRAEALRKQGWKAQASVVQGDSPAEAILAAASTPDTLIAIATHGRSGFARLLMGSVADKVIRGAIGPVLVVRPAQSS